MVEALDVLRARSEVIRGKSIMGSWHHLKAVVHPVFCDLQVDVTHARGAIVTELQPRDIYASGFWGIGHCDVTHRSSLIMLCY